MVLSFGSFRSLCWNRGQSKRGPGPVVLVNHGMTLLSRGPSLSLFTLQRTPPPPSNIHRHTRAYTHTPEYWFACFTCQEFRFSVSCIPGSVIFLFPNPLPAENGVWTNDESGFYTCFGELCFLPMWPSRLIGHSVSRISRIFAVFVGKRKPTWVFPDVSLQKSRQFGILVGDRSVGQNVALYASPVARNYACLISAVLVHST